MPQMFIVCSQDGVYWPRPTGSEIESMKASVHPAEEGKVSPHACSQIHRFHLPQRNSLDISHFFVCFYVNHFSCKRPHANSELLI